MYKKIRFYPLQRTGIFLVRTKEYKSLSSKVKLVSIKIITLLKIKSAMMLF